MLLFVIIFTILRLYALRLDDFYEFLNLANWRPKLLFKQPTHFLSINIVCIHKESSTFLQFREHLSGKERQILNHCKGTLFL